MKKKIISEKTQLHPLMGLAGTSILLPREVMAALSKLKSPIKLGLIRFASGCDSRRPSQAESLS